MQIGVRVDEMFGFVSWVQFDPKVIIAPQTPFESPFFESPNDALFVKSRVRFAEL